MILVNNRRTFNKLLDALDSATIIGIDTEFSSLDVYASTLLLISMAVNGEKFVLDMTVLPKNYLADLKPYLENPAILKVGHNLIAEWKQLYHNCRIMMAGMHDTMIAEQMLFGGLVMRFSLREVANRRLGIDLDKTVREEFIDWQPGQTFSQQQLEYSADDAVHPLVIYVQQMAEIEEKELQRIYDLEMSIIAPTAIMEYTGAYINREMLEAMIEPFNHFVQQADHAFQDILIEFGAAEQILFSEDGYSVINAGSPKQVLEAMNRIGINVSSMNSKVVQRWDLMHTNKKGKKDRSFELDYHDLMDDEEVADALDDYRMLNNKVLRAYAFLTGAKKLVSTFIEGMIAAINPITKRIHANFKSYGAGRTGRYSSWGPNFQNIPNDLKLKLLGLGQYSIRKAIEAPKGRKLIIADYSGIELVILAVLSGDTQLMDQILNGDIHSYVVREIFGIQDISDQNKKEEPFKSWRQAAKRVSYSNAYGTTGANLSDQVNIDLAKIGQKFTKKEADDIIVKWFALFPQTSAYLENNAKLAVQQLYVTDAWGRRRNWDKQIIWFSNPRDRYWKQLAAGREGKNAPIQGTSATMTKLAMKLMWERLDIRKARMIITVHDEVVLEAVDSYVEEAKTIMKESMEEAIRLVLPDIADKVGLYESLSVDPKESERYDK
jgi:DNA polymerase I